MLLFFLLFLFFGFFLFRHFLGQRLLQHALGQRHVVQGVLVIGPQCQRVLVGIDGALEVAELVAGVTEVVERICLDLVSLDVLEGLAGFRVAAGAVECHAAAIAVGEALGRLAVIAVIELGSRLLLPGLEPGCPGGCRAEQAGKQQCAAQARQAVSVQCAETFHDVFGR